MSIKANTKAFFCIPVILKPVRNFVSRNEITKIHTKKVKLLLHSWLKWAQGIFCFLNVTYAKIVTYINGNCYIDRHMLLFSPWPGIHGRRESTDIETTE